MQYVDTELAEHSEHETSNIEPLLGIKMGFLTSLFTSI
jgi:hypothetical protein